MLVTVFAMFSNIHYLFTLVSGTNIQKVSPTSKLCHQHPKIVTNFKSPTSRCHQHKLCYCHRWADFKLYSEHLIFVFELTFDLQCLGKSRLQDEKSKHCRTLSKPSLSFPAGQLGSSNMPQRDSMVTVQNEKMRKTDKPKIKVKGSLICRPLFTN